MDTQAKSGTHLLLHSYYMPSTKSKLHEQLAHLHTGNTQTKLQSSNVASDEDIMENNFMFVTL